MSTILYLSRLYKFVIKLRLLLASGRLPCKHSKAHNLTHVLSLLGLFTKKFKKRRCNCPVYRYKWGEADYYEFYIEDPIGVEYIYAKWYKTFQHVWTKNPSVHFRLKTYKKTLNKKYFVSLKVNLNTADKTLTLLIKSLVMLLMHSCDTWLPIIWLRCCSLDTELIIWLLNNTEVSQSLAFEKNNELTFAWVKILGILVKMVQAE